MSARKSSGKTSKAGKPRKGDMRILGYATEEEYREAWAAKLATLRGMAKEMSASDDACIAGAGRRLGKLFRQFSPDKPYQHQSAR